ncbi:MAG: phosphoadenosine phosphosulfate reductase family protein, partial [Desulfohalobiaceae bacterium]|nr:phosphoadenosine phosphosulfate reductase family protein [Desulfohalobiaceae bacterium]
MPEENLSLPEKVERSRERLQRIARDKDPSSVYVAWTGGKDSTVVLWLWKTTLRDLFPDSAPGPQALRVETGLEFSEIDRFCDSLKERWGLTEQRAGADTDSMPQKPGNDPADCCRYLKIEPLRRAVTEMGATVLLTGLRRDEHSGRSGRCELESRQDPEFLQANPILEWTEMDVWSFILAESLPYCSLYEQGYRSLDCRPCTERSERGERGGRNRAKER